MYTDLFKEYFTSQENFINIVNVLNESVNVEPEDHLLGVDEDFLHTLGNPNVVGTDEDQIQIIDVNDPDTLLRIAGSCADASYKMITGFQHEVIDSLYSAIQLYNNGRLTSVETVGFIQCIYAGILLAYEKSLANFTHVFRLELSDADFKKMESDLQDLILRTIQFNKKIQKRGKTDKEYEKELDSLKSEVLKLSKMLGHEMSKTQKIAESKKKEIRKNEDQRAELANLRELIFAYQNNEEQPPDPNIAFPVRTEKNIYCLGGLPAWINRMKTLAPDIKYLSSDQNIRLNDKLDKADEIWFQINGLSHAQYYAATAIADRCGIPCKYFVRQSPVSCAAQIKGGK